MDFTALLTAQGHLGTADLKQSYLNAAHTKTSISCICFGTAVKALSSHKLSFFADELVHCIWVEIANVAVDVTLTRDCLSNTSTVNTHLESLTFIEDTDKQCNV